MRITLDKLPLGTTGDLLFHVTTYCDDLSGEHGTMHLVRAESMAKALYLAWCNEFDDERPFDIEMCDGYLIGHLEHSL